METLLADEARWQAYQQFLQKWLSRETQSTILVTSQERPKLALRASAWLSLAGLSPEAGVALLQSLAIQGTREALQTMVELADGHPLLLQLTVEWSRQERGDAANVDFVLSQADLNLLTDIVGEHRDNPETNVERVLEQMMARLPSRLQTLWLNLSVYRQAVDEVQAKAMLPDATIADLRLLARRSLLQEQPTETSWQFSFLPLLKTFAQQRVGEQPAAHERAIKYYSSVTKPQPWQTIGDIAAYLELFYHSCALGQYEQAFDAIHHCAAFLGQEGYDLLMVQCYERLVHDGKTSLQQHKWKLGAAFHALASAYRAFLEHSDKAIDFYAQALAIARDVGDYHGEVCTLIGLGSTYGSLKKSSQAIALFEQSLEVAQKNSDLSGEAIALANLGTAYGQIQHYSQALDCYQRSLRRARQAGDRRGEAATLNSLGNVYKTLRHYPQAIEYYQQSLEIKQQLGNRRGETMALNTLGVTYFDAGIYQKAIECHLQALKIDQRMDYRPHAVVSLTNVGNACLELGHNVQAHDYYQQALEIAQQIGDFLGEAGALTSLGNALGRMGKTAEKRSAYERARELYQLIGWEPGVHQCDEVLQKLAEG